MRRGADRTLIRTLAAVLALSSADTATVGASSTQLERALSVGRAQLGMLIAVTGLVSAAATVPFGNLVDKVNRVRLLSLSVLTWGAIMAASTAATSFAALLGMRCLLGVATAVSGPAVASLIGDSFPDAARARVYGYVLSGELIGTGVGFVCSGLLAAIDWRVSFGSLALPAAFVARSARSLPEPPRRHDADPAAEHMSLVAAMRRVLSVRTNVVLIVSSSLGYFFFAGLQGFGIAFVKQSFGVGQTAASLLALVVGTGAVIGVLAGGRLADGLIARGVRTARVVVAGGATVLTVAMLLPAMQVSGLAAGLPLMTLGALFLAASNPPLDAARLDVMSARLWGRAEAARSVLRSGAEAVAALLFGFLSGHVFSGPAALANTFTVTLAPLALSAVVLLVVARRTYPADAEDARSSSEPSSAR